MTTQEQTATAIGGRRIETYTGVLVDPCDPDPINMADIAHALSMICRFNGHTSRHYSVAEHSLCVAELVRLWSDDTNAAQALMHDAAEAYMGDTVSPIKRDPEMAWMRAAEQTCLERILQRFGLATELHALVKHADTVLLHCEASVLMCSGGGTWRDHEYGRSLVRSNPMAVEWVRDGFFRADRMITTKAMFLSAADRLGLL